MIHVELITPEKLAFSDNVDFIAAPTELGEIGVLPGHAPLLARLAPGELRLRTGDTTRHVAVSGGFIEIGEKSRVAVFAETAEFADEIDVERARQKAEEARVRLQERDLTPAEMAELEASLSRAALRIRVGTNRGWRKPNPPQPPH